MLDLKRRGPDVRRFVATLEEWIIATLAAFNVRGERRDDRIGVWVRRPEKGEGHEDKIAAIGIRVKQWVTLHGIALNVDPDLLHFSGIVPCGVSNQRYAVTSLADLGLPVSMAEVDMILRREFAPLFGPTTDQTVGSTENKSLPAGSSISVSVPSR
jgi:lipoyl(octanoyl) transferase